MTAIQFLDTMMCGITTLVAIHPELNVIVARGFDRGSLGDVEPWLTQHERLNLYWTPNVVGRLLDKKPTKADIVIGCYAHADIDDPSEVALKRLREYRLPPTAIVASGGGYNAYWRIEDLPLTPSNRQQLEAVNQRLIADLGGDPGTWNVDRILRLPGTRNWPGAKKRAKGRVPVDASVVLQ